MKKIIALLGIVITSLSVNAGSITIVNNTPFAYIIGNTHCNPIPPTTLGAAVAVLNGYLAPFTTMSYTDPGTMYNQLTGTSMWTAYTSSTHFMIQVDLTRTTGGCTFTPNAGGGSGSAACAGVSSWTYSLTGPTHNAIVTLFP